MKFILAPCVFIQAHHSEILTASLFKSLVPYPTTLPNLQPDGETPILLYGDLIIENSLSKALLEFMKEHYNPLHLIHCAW
jgi:hypothetical protein